MQSNTLLIKRVLSLCQRDVITLETWGFINSQDCIQRNVSEDEEIPGVLPWLLVLWLMRAPVQVEGLTLAGWQLPSYSLYICHAQQFSKCYQGCSLQGVIGMWCAGDLQSHLLPHPLPAKFSKVCGWFVLSFQKSLNNNTLVVKSLWLRINDYNCFHTHEDHIWGTEYTLWSNIFIRVRQAVEILGFFFCENAQEL